MRDGNFRSERCKDRFDQAVSPCWRRNRHTLAVRGTQPRAAFLCSGFCRAPRRMQDPFGIALRLRLSLQDESHGCLKSDAVEGWRHRPIVWIALVLRIDNYRHPLENFADLRSGDDAVPKPICDMLA